MKTAEEIKRILDEIVARMRSGGGVEIVADETSQRVRITFAKFPACVNPDLVDEFAAFCHDCDVSTGIPATTPDDEAVRFVAAFWADHKFCKVVS